MDISAEYIKMCKKAGTLQELHDLQHGDYYVLNGKVELLFRPFAPPRNIVGAVWLPRQDQLQEMYEFPAGSEDHHCNTIEWVPGGFRAWYKSGDGSVEVAGGRTLEQLWLAILMKVKFDQIWTGQAWMRS